MRPSTELFLMTFLDARRRLSRIRLTCGTPHVSCQVRNGKEEP